MGLAKKGIVFSFTPLFMIFGVACATSTPAKKDLGQAEKAKLLVEVANGALLEGDPMGALEQLEKAELEDDSIPELYHTRALAFYARHSEKEALVSARKAVELKPNYAEANNTLGKLLLDQGQYGESEKYLKRAAETVLYRDAYKAWTGLGISKYRQKKYSEATAFFDRAILDAPLQACVAYYYKGHIHLGKMKYEEAIRDYGLATKKACGSFSDAHFSLGLAYQKNRQYELARKTYLEIQKLYPQSQIARQALDQMKYLP